MNTIMTTTTNTCTISSLSHDGRGIAHIDGKTTFVAGALPEEIVTYTYVRRHPSFDEAKCQEILQASPMRATPQCPHYAICGGCNLQHIQHKAQLDLKQKVLLEQLDHIGNITPQNILPPIVGPIYNYRYKARLSVKFVHKKNKVLVGFHEKNGRFIAEIETCPILHKAFSNNITTLSAFVASLDNYQQIPQIEIACGYGDTNNSLVIRHLCAFTSGDLEKIKAFAATHNYHIFLQPQGLESTHSLTHDTDLLSYTAPIHNLLLSFKPTDFTQINYQINQQMISKVVELLDTQAQEKILDLFCGIGNFTLPIATKCQFCVGVEGSATAISRAIFNAEQNTITNTKFYNFDLSKDFSNQEWAKSTYDKIIIDPPRTGALECIKQLAQFKAKKIIYISCNPATLARDCKELVQQGYTMTHAGIIDMFPHTNHVETMAVFVRSRLKTRYI